MCIRDSIETDLLNNFKRLGVVAAPLNGFERLHVMHDILRMDEQEPFRFSWDWLAPSGLSTKDFIAPSSFESVSYTHLVIDFAAALYGLGKKEAAVQLAQDFGLSYEDWKPPGKEKKPKPRCV